MTSLFKWVTVPKSNETKEVEAVQMYEVRWESRHGEHFHDIRPELECFTSQAAAEDFAESLRKAFALIRHTSGRRVIVGKAS